MLIKANPPPPNWTHKPVLLPAPSGGGPRLSALPELPDREPAAIKTTLLVTPANLQVRVVPSCVTHRFVVCFGMYTCCCYLTEGAVTV